jgi:ABC-type antimicrobial peptide transport system permease subunit
MLAEAVQDAIREVDPQLGVVGMETLSARVDRKLTPESLVADISGFFGVLSLLLVSIGIYGTLAYAVAHRTHEVGIRMALSARPGSIFEMILREIVWALGGGVALGVLAFLAIGPLVESLLFEIPPSDPATIGTAALLLTAVALFAAYLPARRASRVDPLVALRHE